MKQPVFLRFRVSDTAIEIDVGGVKNFYQFTDSSLK
jgi:hypothetical protein